MKILLLNALDIYGGGEFFVYQFASLLKKNGHEVWVSCRPDNPIRRKCEQEGINVYPLCYPKRSKRRIIKISRALRNLVKKTKFSWSTQIQTMTAPSEPLPLGLEVLPMLLQITVFIQFSITSHTG